MKIHTPGQAFVPRRIAVYGPSKSGKTRLATSLPWGSDWGDKAIYVAWDPGSEELGSVLSGNRDHLIVVRPDKPLTRAGGKYDPLGEAVKIATFDWKKEYPTANTIIWDTGTETSRDLLAAYADSGQFSDKHVSFGKPGSLEYHAAPMEGDYGAAQRSTIFILEYLDRQPLHKILLFHDELVEPKENMPGSTFGGPALAGKAGTKIIAGRYDNLFRCGTKQIVIPPNKTETKYVVTTRPSGHWLAGFRHPTEINPIPQVDLPPNPVTFWTAMTSAVDTPLALKQI
jgi:hypothetical protein